MSKGGPKTGHCRQVGSVKLYVGTRGTYWVGRYRRTVDGKTKEQGIRLGSPPETTEEQARAMLAEITRKTYKQSLWADNFGARGLIRELTQKDQAKLSVRQIRGGTGAWSEMVVCADLLSKGFDVFRAINPQCECDLICRMGRDLVRIEVKTAVNVRKVIAVQLTDREGSFDVLAVVSRDGKVSYTGAAQIESAFLVSKGFAEQARRVDAEGAA